MNRKIPRLGLLSLVALLLLALTLAACSGAGSSSEPAVSAVVEPTSMVTQVPTEAVAYPLETAPPAAVAPQEAYPAAEGQAVVAYPGAELSYPGPEGAYLPPARQDAQPTQLATEPARPTQAAVEPAQPTRAPRVEFVATDPATVQLASGQVQLVEFFAFW